MVAAAYERAAGLRPLWSFLVLRNGDLVGEEYFHGARPDTAYNVKSDSKSVLSALTGIAIHQGFIKGLDQPICDFFPEYCGPLPDTLVGWAANPSRTLALKRQVTVRNLLTHTPGFAFDEDGLLFSAWLWSGDYVRFYLELPFVRPPRDRFLYSTAGTHVLSALLTRATGMSTREYAERNLFGPMGIEVHRWDRERAGTFIGGAEMHLTARAMAKFGLLYLNGGSWGGEQIVPGDWVKESTGEHIRASYEPPLDPQLPPTWTRWRFLETLKYTGYGYLWWRRDSRGHETWVAMGYGGQYIFVVPDLQLTVVTTSAWDRETNPNFFEYYTNLHALLDEYIIPAAGSDGLNPDPQS